MIKCRAISTCLKMQSKGSGNSTKWYIWLEVDEEIVSKVETWHEEQDRIETKYYASTLTTGSINLRGQSPPETPKKAVW